MEELSSCKTAIEHCLSTKTFAIAHLYKEEKAMDMHIHDCYELYYSISGGRQFLMTTASTPSPPETCSSSTSTRAIS